MALSKAKTGLLKASVEEGEFSSVCSKETQEGESTERDQGILLYLSLQGPWKAC
jgi:hypothetical protein